MRRFGRNQKRRMREQIENALTAETTIRELARQYSDKLRSAIDEIRDAKRIIGENSALFTPEHRRADRRYREYDVAMIPDISMRDIGNTPVNASFERISLPVMLLEVENRDSEAFDRLGRMIHMRLHFADDSIGYACQPDAIRHMGVNRIAHEMARLLHDKLSDLSGRR